MAHVQIQQSSPRIWLYLGCGIAATVAAMAWHQWRPVETAHQATLAETPQMPVTTAVAPTPTEPTAADREALETLKAQQAQAARALEAQPVQAPVKGQVDERPEFISAMEWSVLQAVAQQHAHPEEELPRLINAVRFNKQLELWQDMPADADANKRRVLAEALLKDLPERVKQGNYGLVDAQKYMTGLVKDLEADEARQQARANAEMRRLTQADEAYRRANP